jgi:hypothetical protein
VLQIAEWQNERGKRIDSSPPIIFWSKTHLNGMLSFFPPAPRIKHADGICSEKKCFLENFVIRVNGPLPARDQFMFFIHVFVAILPKTRVARLAYQILDFGRPWNGKCLYMLWSLGKLYFLPFGYIYGNLVYFMVILVRRTKDKSGNPVKDGFN